MNHIAASLVIGIVNTLAPAALLAVSVWLIFRLGFRAPAAWRHTAWWCVLAAILVLPAAPWFRAQVELAAMPAANEAAAQPQSFAAERGPALVQSEAIPQPQQVSRRNWLPLEIPRGNWPVAVLALAGVAFLIQCARILWSYRHLSRVKAQAVPASAELRASFDEWSLACRIRRPVRLLISDEIQSPIAVGFRRPAVVLPAAVIHQLSGRDLDHVVLHELAHLARRDDWSNLMARFLQGVLAFHPVANWILRQLDREREMACDEWVVEVTGQVKPYAASLARVFELCLARRQALLASGMAVRPSHLRERIGILLRRERDHADGSTAGARWRVVLGAGVLTCAVLFALGSPEWIAYAQVAPEPAASPQPVAAPAAPQPPAPPAARVPRPVAAPPAPAAPAAVPATAPAPAPRVFGGLAPAVPVDPVLAEAPAAPPAPVLAMAQTPTPAAAPVPPPPSAPPAPAVAGSEKGESFLASLAAAGYGDLNVDQIIDLKINGITGVYIREMTKAFGKQQVKDLIDLRINGVSGEYVQQMKDAGLSNATPRELIEARIHGLKPPHVREARKLGPALSLQQILKLKIAGVI